MQKNQSGQAAFLAFSIYVRKHVDEIDPWLPRQVLLVDLSTQVKRRLVTCLGFLLCVRLLNPKPLLNLKQSNGLQRPLSISVSNKSINFFSAKLADVVVFKLG